MHACPSTSQHNSNDQSLDACISELTRGAHRLRTLSLASRSDLLDACATRVGRVADAWVRAACGAKQIDADQATAAEEILAGPSSMMRYLRLLSQTYRDVETRGMPNLPGKIRTNSLGRRCVPIMPVKHLYDPLIFMGLQAEVWLKADSKADDPVFVHSWLPEANARSRIAGVLGAGNVSAIPATDAFHKIFLEHEAVLLKLNPVNDYLFPIFQDAFQPLIDADLLRIVRGNHEFGEAMVRHPDIDSLHLTGSNLTHDAIVWGTDAEERSQRRRDNQPLVTQSITSELGNVTPWVIVPGEYSRRQLLAQAEHVASSIVNNASFNCIATKMIVTSRHWRQRDEFLELVDSVLRKIPPRVAYYPGAHDRFRRAAGVEAVRDDGTLPWTLIRDSKPSEQPHLFLEESFVCVCAETQLDEGSPDAFLDAAVDFVNDKLFGTLCATITVPNSYRKQHQKEIEQAIDRLRYGAVCINQWSGIVFGLMTPPWGGHHSATIQSPQSGIGHVHNTFGLTNIDKTVLFGPLASFPKPVWFPTHQTSHRVGRSLISLYQRPSPLRLLPIFFHALRG